MATAKALDNVKFDGESDADSQERMPARSLPVYQAGEVVAHAKIDQDDFARLAPQKWVISSSIKKPHTVVLTPASRVTLFLARAVLGLEVGSGDMVKYQDGDYLNVTKENLFLQGKTASFTKKAVVNKTHWPRKFEILLAFYKKRNDVRMSRLLKAAEVEKFSRKLVLLKFDAEASEAAEGRLLSTVEYMQERFERDLNFKGQVKTYVSDSPAPQVEATLPPRDPLPPQETIGLKDASTSERTLAMPGQSSGGINLSCDVGATKEERALFLETLATMLASQGVSARVKIFRT